MSNPTYFTPEGLSLLQTYESGGNPQATNPSSSASGLYGFLTGTWDEYAPQAGVDLAEYPTAASAPSDIQTSVAEITPSTNWTCLNCDAPITNAIASDPSLISSSPTTGDIGNGLDLTASDPSFANPFYVPGTGAVASYGPNDPFGLLAAAQNALTGNPLTGAPAGSSTGNPNYFTDVIANIENWLQRGALIILGIVLLAGAAYALSNKDVNAAISRGVSAIPG